MPRKHHHSDETIQKQIDANEFAPARELAHAIKGSAGNLGAAELQQAASVVESLLIDENTSEIIQAVSIFSDTLGKCIRQIQQLDIHTETESEKSASAEAHQMNTQRIIAVAHEIIDLIPVDYSLALEKTNELVPLIKSTSAGELGRELQNQMDIRCVQELEHMPPSAGCALGLDRLIMLVCNVQGIEDVIFFSESDC